MHIFLFWWNSLSFEYNPLLCNARGNHYALFAAFRINEPTFFSLNQLLFCLIQLYSQVLLFWVKVFIFLVLVLKLAICFYLYMHKLCKNTIYYYIILQYCPLKFLMQRFNSFIKPYTSLKKSTTYSPCIFKSTLCMIFTNVTRASSFNL